MKTPTIDGLARIIAKMERRLAAVERPTWPEVNPLFSAAQTASQSIPGFVWVPISLQSVIVDNMAGFATASPSRYTAQRAGWYIASGVVGFANGGTSFRAVKLTVNGADVPGSSQDAAASGDYTVVSAPSTPVYLNIGDYVELQGFAGGATSTATDVVQYRSRLNVWRHSI